MTKLDIKKKLPIIFFSALIFGLFIVYGSFYQGVNTFSSPDETANYFFASRFQETGQLSYQEPLNTQVGDIVHSRSTKAVDGQIAPGSFIGMPLLYGAIGGLYGSWLLLWLTPLFAVLGVVFFYLFIRKIFKEKTALYSMLLLVFMPPFWHFASRGMFHNVLFLSLAIIGLYLLLSYLQAVKNQRNIFWIMAAGMVLGLALIVRTAEAVWVGVTIIVLLLVYRKSIRWKELGLLAAGGSIVLLPVLYINADLYGSPFTFSYNNPAIAETVNASGSTETGINWLRFLFPFGLDIGQSLQVAKIYLIEAIPWYGVLISLGIVGMLAVMVWHYLTKYVISHTSVALPPKSVRVYLFIYLGLVLWLMAYYGAFSFTEYIDPDEVLLGSSYLRYWLPLLVFGLPLMVYAITSVTRLWKPRWRRAVVTLIVTAIVILSFVSTLGDPLHGLLIIRQENQRNVQLREEVVALTPADAVIISGDADKVFFPKRRVVYNYPEGSEQASEYADSLIANGPLYLFGKDFDQRLTDERAFFEKMGYAVEEVLVKPPATLYRIGPR